MNLLADTFCRLDGGLDLGNDDVVRLKKAPYVNGSFNPKRVANGQNPWSLHLAAFDAMADEVCVGQHGGNVKDGGKAPACQHLLQL